MLNQLITLTTGIIMALIVARLSMQGAVRKEIGIKIWEKKYELYQQIIEIITDMETYSKEILFKFKDEFNNPTFEQAASIETQLELQYKYNEEIESTLRQKIDKLNAVYLHCQIIISPALRKLLINFTNEINEVFRAKGFKKIPHLFYLSVIFAKYYFQILKAILDDLKIIEYENLKWRI